MRFTLYQPDQRRLFIGDRGRRSPFGHAFGGSAEYTGLAFRAGRPPVHLLFSLNTVDPAVGLTLPQATWLPLLCAVRYGACALGYRVVSDGAVKVLRQEAPKPWDDFPYPDYPNRFPARPVALTEVAYNPRSVRSVLASGAAFGYAHLSPSMRSRVGRRAAKWGELFGGYPVTPDEALETWADPFVQGRPVEDCPDRRCKNHGRPSCLRTLAVFEEGRVECRQLWGPNGGNLQIIWQVCPVCGAVQATNQCT